jgi:hypothetical protein
MARVNDNGYVDRKIIHGVFRDWWLIKNSHSQYGGCIDMKRISFPEEYVGKKIRIKIEVEE